MKSLDIKNIAQNYLSDLKDTIDKISLEDIQKVADVLLEAYKKNNTVFLLGNGGAASTASHIACDWGKGTLKNVYDLDEKRLRVISLTDNMASATAFANDLSFDDMFVQQLQGLIKEEDVVIGISGSGNTPNVVRALIYAKSKGAKTIGFLGFHGGSAREFVDCEVTIQSSSYGIIEDLHLSINHLLTVCLSYMKEIIDQKDISGNGIVKGIGNSKLKRINKTKNTRKVASEWTERSARR